MKRALAFLAIMEIFSIWNGLGFPRFAYRIGASCQNCHVNPTGAGMRNTYGVTYGQETLPVKSWQQDVGLENFSTNLSDFISFGADFRTRTVYGTLDNSTSFSETGDLYFLAKLNQKLSVYLDTRITSGMEVFGMAKILPMKGYLKVGKFSPAYGIRLEDRNNRAEDTGFELGVAPGNFTFSSGMFNGSSDDKRKVFVARADTRIEFGDIKTSVGGSVYQQPSSAVDLRLLSVFGGGSYSDMTVFGEVDFRRDENNAGIRNGLLSYVEGDYVVTSGIDLKFIYEYYDPDVDVKSGNFSAYTIGIEFFPIAGLEMKPLYRIQKESPTEINNDEFHLLFHFYL